jgi:hypothetical protein
VQSNLTDCQNFKKGDFVMAEEVATPTHRQQFVWVKDKAGNEFACPVDVLKKPEDMTEEERKNCVADASIHQPHAGG